MASRIFKIIGKDNKELGFLKLSKVTHIKSDLVGIPLVCLFLIEIFLPDRLAAWGIISYKSAAIFYNTTQVLEFDDVV